MSIAVLQASAATVMDAGIEGSSTCCIVLVDTLQARALVAARLYLGTDALAPL